MSRPFILQLANSNAWPIWPGIAEMRGEGRSPAATLDVESDQTYSRL
jgi:hypothetical protein